MSLSPNGEVISEQSLSGDDQETIETLVFDSADNFFLGQMQGVATRMLGSRFRLDDGTTANYAGPFYDIYQINSCQVSRQIDVFQSWVVHSFDNNYINIYIL